MRTIVREEVLLRMRAENPWWQSPNQIPSEFQKYRPRPYLKLFFPLVTKTEVRRSILLMGPRRVGKTVMIHHAIGKLIEGGTNPKMICYISVDHPIYNGCGLETLVKDYLEASESTALAGERFVFFDEVQYLKDWEIHLKILVDSSSETKYIASGSAAAALKLRSSESGAGRFTDFLLPPLTFHEYLDLINRTGLVHFEAKNEGSPFNFGKANDLAALNDNFVNYLNFGGYPEVALSPTIQADAARFVKGDIIDKVLLRDLPSLYGIQDIQELNYLFTTLAYNTANEVSLEQLSTSSGVAKNTIKRYIEYLEAAFLIKIVHRLNRNAKRFQRANFFKVYLTNPSMRSALFSPINAEHEVMGALAETGIFAQWFHTDFRLYYGRWDNGEVDIVALNPDQKLAWAVEVKWSDRFVDRPGELRSLMNFCRVNKLPQVAVTSRTLSATKTIDDVEILFVPASLYCYTVGYNIVRGKNPLKQLILPEKVATTKESALQ